MRAFVRNACEGGVTVRSSMRKVMRTVLYDGAASVNFYLDARIKPVENSQNIPLQTHRPCPVPPVTMEVPQERKETIITYVD